MHFKVNFIHDHRKHFVSFVYAENTERERKPLWRNLTDHCVLVNGEPWAVLGDFNVTIKVEECSNSFNVIDKDMEVFRRVLCNLELEDITSYGMFYTWIQKRMNPEAGILKKLDRILGNASFPSSYGSCFANFLPYMTSDHCPATLIYTDVKAIKPRSFRFMNFLTDKPGFLSTVKDNRCLEALRVELKRVQSSLDNDSNCVHLREEEYVYCNAYKKAISDEEKVLRQKTKIQWLKEGDQNSAYFHNSLKGGMYRSMIEVADLIDINRWKWPNGWNELFSEVVNVQVPNLIHDCSDKVLWFNKENDEVQFSVKEAWKVLRDDVPKVMCCGFAQGVWNKLKSMCRLDDLSFVWAEIVSGIAIRKANNTLWSIIQSADKVFDIIVDTVRLRLLGLKIKRSPEVDKVATIWKLRVQYGAKVGTLWSYYNFGVMESSMGMTSSFFCPCACGHPVVITTIYVRYRSHKGVLPEQVPWSDLVSYVFYGKQRKLQRRSIYATTTSIRGKLFYILENRFETYVKSKDIDLWYIIAYGDYKPTFKDSYRYPLGCMSNDMLIVTYNALEVFWLDSGQREVYSTAAHIAYWESPLCCTWCLSIREGNGNLIVDVYGSFLLVAVAVLIGETVNYEAYGCR
ncbi:RNA-directed DNA polymerase, eukaryota, reverse transcriptase zinc-binding domain protein [Tanacetum coccineum]|uniref:RNA-directed DNA polymerase, eukaryota, reverse transcriptase zinc-binding domain protein n=1 Tax=Tanacetum coccineum TaxID=301880 RepID=A0ABQ5HY87_9ASTR